MKGKYSGKEINKAGEDLLDDDVRNDEEKFNKSMDVLSYWRFQHESPLEKALVLMKNEVSKRDRKAIFAKRLKRNVSIIEKLKRFPGMKLKNMQDVGGCRAVLSSQKQLYKVVGQLRKVDEFKNSEGRIRFKDYIAEPKEDGYKSYHLIGCFSGGNGQKRLIELQFRTRIQHSWATALEIIDLFTGQALKSSQGAEDWKEFFRLVSQQFSLMDSIPAFYSLPVYQRFFRYYEKVENNVELLSSIKKISEIDSSLRVFGNFEVFSKVLRIIDQRGDTKKADGYVLVLVDTNKNEIQLNFFSPDMGSMAEKEYLRFEKNLSGVAGMTIALVSASVVGGIKQAYPNYFADSSEFLGYTNLILEVNRKHNPGWIQAVLNRTGLGSGQL